MTETGIPYNKQKPKQPPDEIGINSPDMSEPHRELSLPPNISISIDANSESKPQFICQICGRAFDTSEELQAHTTTEHAKTAVKSNQ
jgi:hypothetical protein